MPAFHVGSTTSILDHWPYWLIVVQDTWEGIRLEKVGMHKPGVRHSVKGAEMFGKLLSIYRSLKVLYINYQYIQERTSYVNLKCRKMKNIIGLLTSIRQFKNFHSFE